MRHCAANNAFRRCFPDTTRSEDNTSKTTSSGLVLTDLTNSKWGLEENEATWSLPATVEQQIVTNPLQETNLEAERGGHMSH
jgi:hypothetical protein